MFAWLFRARTEPQKPQIEPTKRSEPPGDDEEYVRRIEESQVAQGLGDGGIEESSRQLNTSHCGNEGFFKKPGRYI